MPRIRLYFEDGEIKEFDVERACDDHGRVVLGFPWPKEKRRPLDGIPDTHEPKGFA